MVEREPRYLEYQNGEIVSKPKIVKGHIPEHKEPLFKVAISLPVYERWEAQFGYSLAKLMLYSGVGLVSDEVAVISLNMIEATYLDKARNDLVVQALNTDATHILWLDCDMKFPQDALMHLLATGKEIVGANYPRRRFPPDHTAFKSVSKESNDKHIICRTQVDSKGLEPVDALGFGICLMQTKIFKEMPQPWFEVNNWGEDVGFCMKAKEMGYQPYVDHDLSKVVIHYGGMGYSFYHAEDYQKMKEEKREPRMVEVA